MLHLSFSPLSSGQTLLAGLLLNCVPKAPWHLRHIFTCGDKEKGRWLVSWNLSHHIQLAVQLAPDNLLCPVIPSMLPPILWVASRLVQLCTSLGQSIWCAFASIPCNTHLLQLPLPAFNICNMLSFSSCRLLSSALMWWRKSEETKNAVMIFIDTLWSNPHSTPWEDDLPSVSVEGTDSGIPAGLPAQGHKLAKGQGKASNASQSHSNACVYY